MSKKNKKRVVVTTEKRDNLKPTTAKVNPGNKKVENQSADSLLYGRENYKWMLIGFALVLIGMFLMMGGKNPSPEIWDENIIYSTRRTFIAPVFILAGLIVEVYAILKTK